MRTYTFWLALATAAPVLAVPAQADLMGRSSITPITTSGNAFFQGNRRFYIRGVNYAPGSGFGVVDPIANEASCSRDIVEFKKLGINTIQINAVDNTANHDACMNAFAEADIYVVLDVNTPKYALNAEDPAPSYNSVYLQNVFATIDMFAKYPNTLAFLSGADADRYSTDAVVPYVKAVTRDMRQYIGSRGYRKIPVGYSVAQIPKYIEMADYMNCGTPDERSDFFAFENYSWCNPSSLATSDWDNIFQNFTNYGIPIFMSGYGCFLNVQNFEEVAALYSTEIITSVCSGGLVYGYSEEGRGNGLVIIDSPTAITELPSFLALQAAYKATPNPRDNGRYNTTGGPSKCPTTSPTWKISSDAPLPAIPSAAAELVRSGAGKGAGLSGSGSQDAGAAAAPSNGAVATTSPAEGSGMPLRLTDISPLIIGMIVYLILNRNSAIWASRQTSAHLLPLCDIDYLSICGSVLYSYGVVVLWVLWRLA
ncbi:hypothetical protein V492_07597 [Pseudogymnoascus sp. VKM F-4246]|nr:hypothetical protein V492_07597 [Pseudogymnoascus sp. VKM F-4246]